jgi:hypothetical protein
MVVGYDGAKAIAIQYCERTPFLTFLRSDHLDTNTNNFKKDFSINTFL